MSMILQGQGRHGLEAPPAYMAWDMLKGRTSLRRRRVQRVRNYSGIGGQGVEEDCMCQLLVCAFASGNCGGGVPRSVTLVIDMTEFH